ncbi:outer membrane protein assembly factor BamD [Aliikangiella coralliicola]|uniref:Outer membrane protein assembly factor BamD n=1 Tax=Aliikangiella coralliicola TaxID=2592383 RepID=A0A545U0L8_9GAMM|nr:outer membrane protein assembly factor BamD [Aliikangiella coralliicola]TQV82994.1 outer membrane protein assembly factor BamD [Aliikangiella coralliicola]
MRILKIVSTLLLLVVVSACSGKKEVLTEAQRVNNAFKLYEKAQYSMLSGNFRTAIEYLERLDSLYPFGAYSHQAQLDLIYSYYKLDDFASGVSAADRFIRQNPRHKDLEYAYYMKGLINFSSDTGIGKDLFSAPLSERDASTARQSFDDFSELIRLFPNSKYAKDAQQRMVYLRNRLAEYELHVANYYMKREAYQAAASRARYVVDHYPKTPSVPYALRMMMVAYDLLELPEMSERTRRVLLLNYPNFEG